MISNELLNQPHDNDRWKSQYRMYNLVDNFYKLFSREDLVGMELHLSEHNWIAEMKL